MESKVGAGSSFHFTVRAMAAPAPARAYLDEAQPLLQGKRALIVDDNATNRRILSLQLQSWHMYSEDTESPFEALSWLREGKAYDVVVLDMQMPGLDGVGTAREIRALAGPSSKTPLVMLTSLGRGTREEVADFAAFITKPIKPSALFDALVGVFAGRLTRVVLRRATPEVGFDGQMGQRHPLRILLAEDNATNQKLALQLLARLAYHADVAGNGRETLEALARQAYDVVLMDVQMPEIDGLEATRRLRRELPEHRQPHVIAMTANAMQGDQDMCFDAGMDDYVSKPIRVEHLVAALSRSRPLSVPSAAISEGVAGQQVTTRTGPFGPGGPAQSNAMNDQGKLGPKKPVLDPKALQDLLDGLGGEFDLLVELVDTFLEDAPQLLAELQRSLEDGNVPEVHRIAHTLKSNGLDLGASTFARDCKELEALARVGSLHGAGDLYARITSGYARVEAALRELRAAREVA